MGNSKGFVKRGFTLIEVMATTVLLAVGSIAIHEALFTSLTAFSYYADYIDIGPWAHEKMWEVTTALSLLPDPQINTSGTFMSRGRRFDWDVSYSLIEELKKTARFYQVDLVVRWKSGFRTVSLQRSAYVVYRYPSQ
ncbi:MAG TPA: prepilin-type N-terminal cleavage/methylation domain-containing protein [Candidatus Omnitrophota bacterium]|nr:prepilin-type N-terminal cleavage/methylation domain-containing protein [Candidatus Omnitrophota bacterium]HPT07938.1 prepilin-type N-terminal cleavage/methylation domain-containing protein [Candidatus Omnitrophota bacterium]